MTIAHNVTAEEFDRMPKTRSFQGIALTSPGVNQGQIEGGFQVNGASGAENSFTVDGVSTNSVLYGSSRQDTVFEYLQEVQVKTGGIDAEYGGALGGVISAVTKSGGNSFRGEGHYYYFGNGISAGPVQRLQLSPIDDTTVFHVQDEKQKNNTQRGWRFDRRTDRQGSPVLLRCRISPQFVRRDEQLPVLERHRTRARSHSAQTFTQAFGKVTYSAGKVQANASILMTPTRTTGTLPRVQRHEPNTITSSQAGNAANIARGFEHGSDQLRRQRRLSA